MSQSGQPVGVQVAGGNELTDAQALARARRMITLSNPGHPGATPGFEDNRSLQTEVFFEEYARGYAETTLGVAGGPLARGAPTAGRVAVEAGSALARNPTVYVNASDFSVNLARGYQLGRNLNVFSRPITSSPGAWLGHGIGVAYGASSRLGGAVTGWFGP